MRRMLFRAFSGMVLVVVATLVGAGATASSAYADDPLPPPVFPSEVTSSPGFVGPTDPAPASASALPSGSPGGKLSPPSRQQIDDAKAALQRLRHHRRTPAAKLAEVAGPTAPQQGGGLTSRISDQGWWTIGAGLLVLLVASETTRVTVRRAKHRKEA